MKKDEARRGIVTIGMDDERRKGSFGYWRDSLFLLAATGYLVNKFVFKQVYSEGFCHSYVNDLICIPFLLPPILLCLRRLGVRRHDLPPTLFENATAVLAFSVVFEFCLPMLPIRSRYIYGDPWDIVCYAVGGLVGAVWWPVVRFQWSAVSGNLPARSASEGRIYSPVPRSCAVERV